MMVLYMDTNLYVILYVLLILDMNYITCKFIYRLNMYVIS